ncbi:MAG: aminotransferase class I/II-fold pyridoxal phosphate-dependent enzyme [Coxiellaceae bacterium]|nr:aminotransferase class I/II-fold pyridoxal phosphate-dependent enzyme [Coxiellaceae bacterium]
MREIYDFGIGSTHIQLHKDIRKDMARALATTKSPYPSIPPKLISTVFNKMNIAKTLRGALDVTFAAGVRPLITAAIQHLVSKGKSRFALPMPNWSGYQPLLKHMGAHNLPIDILPLAKNRRSHFDSYLKQLNDSLAEADVFVFTPYNNPIGIQYSAEETADIVRLLKRHSHIIILIDDIYAELCAASPPCFLAQYPELHERCIYVAGTTKSHSLRAGYAIAPKPIAEAMDRYLRLITGTPLSLSELAGLQKALTIPIPATTLMRLFNKRDLLIEQIEFIHGWRVINKKPDGASYVLVNVKEDMTTTQCDTAEDYAKRLKLELGIITVVIDKYHLRLCARVDSKVLTMVKRIKSWQREIMLLAASKSFVKTRAGHADSHLLRNLRFLNSSTRRTTRTLTLNDGVTYVK